MKQLLMLSVLLLGGSWVVAQTSASPSQQQGSSPTSSQTSHGGDEGTAGSQSGSGQMAAGSHTVEGCLSGSGGQYTLTDKHGMTYQLTGDTSKLAEHVGHEVKVTGTEAGSASASGGASGSQMGAGSQKTIEVSSVKHVSKTCKSGAGTSGGMSH